MLIGANWPYDAKPSAGEETWRAWYALDPYEVTITTHASADDYQRILDWANSRQRELLWHVRVKTGPQNQGAYPWEIWSYREWTDERSPGDAVEWLLSRGQTPWVILGNEPALELAAIDHGRPDTWFDREIHGAAIDFYTEWYDNAAQAARREWGAAVKLAPAPIEQGAPERASWYFDRWLGIWSSDQCDFLAEHCYTFGQPYATPDAGGRFLNLPRIGKPIDVTEFNDDGRLDAADRPLHLAGYVAWMAAQRRLRSASVFTLPGGASGKPWWPISIETAEALQQARSVVAAYGGPVLAPSPDGPAEPEPVEGSQSPVEAPESPATAPEVVSDAWRWFSPSQIATALAVDQQAVEENWPHVAYAFDALGIRSYRHDLAALATIEVETAGTFYPIAEYGDDAYFERMYGAHTRAGRELGNTEPGDGPRFKGRGWYQCSGRGNYGWIGGKLGLPTLDNPELLKDPSVAAWFAAWFCKERGVPNRALGRVQTLFELAEEGDWKWYRRVVNGGENGMDRFLTSIESLRSVEQAQPRVEAPEAGSAPEAEPEPIRYNPSVPTVLQSGNWQCSAASTAWLLQSLGLHWDQDAVVRWLESRGGIDPDWGLSWGDGRDLVALIEEATGLAARASWASWDVLTLIAGSAPIVMGGQAWYHWAGVRGFDSASGVLLLANPAPNWQGVGQEMDRAEFERFGPFRAVVPVLEEEEDQAMIEQLQATIAAQEKELVGLRNVLGYLTNDEAGPNRALQRALGTYGDATLPREVKKGELIQRLALLSDQVRGASNALDAHKP